MNVKKVIEYIVNWLKEYAEKSKVNGFVIGISGGIDSAVTSTLCARTGFPVLCVEMPIHQDKSQISRGKKHIEQLKNSFKNVTSEEINLTATFEEFKSAIPTYGNLDAVNLSLANTRARLRMTTLYYFAGIRGYLVAGTGNKIEDFGVGFFTKYGDGGVDISPIGDLMKSEVSEIAKYLGVNDAIIMAAPTDGLWGNDKTDEDQIGASYPELEWAMKQVELGKRNSDFIDRQKEVFDIYTKRNRANKHKMIPIPICEIPEELKIE
ncbi:MAG: NAD(+) synthase [Lutibacter sp.]|nr:NAD(+) synthase [Lutibacter sp.]